MAQVVPAWRDSTAWVRHDLWVETDFDSDRDGRKDRVHVDVTRPAQTEGGGLKVPVLYGASPYFAGTSRDDAMWTVQQELGDQPSPRRALAAPVHQPNRRRISNVLVNEWVPRGFAVVHCLGILTSMFSAVFFSRGLVNLWYGRQKKLKSVSIGTVWRPDGSALPATIDDKA